MSKEFLNGEFRIANLDGFYITYVINKYTVPPTFLR